MKQTPLSSPGLTGRPSIPETFEINERPRRTGSPGRAGRRQFDCGGRLTKPQFLPSLLPTSWPTLMNETNTAVIARLDRATQYSRDSHVQSRSRGVLDRPVKPGDDDF